MTKARDAIAAKDYPGAIAILYKLSQGSPQDADVANLLGFSYRMLGQYPQAFTYYDPRACAQPDAQGRARI